MDTPSTMPGPTAPASGVLRFMESLCKYWQADILATRQRRIFFMAAIALLCLIRGYFGTFPIHSATHDLFIHLDGGWRILNGERPHRDFFSNIGAIAYMFPAAALLFSHGVGALSWSQAMFGFVVALWGAWLCSSRMYQVPAVLTCVTLILMAIAPYNTGDRFNETTLAMFHNRFSYALLGLILVECSLAADRAHTDEAVGGVSTGAASAILLFLKFSYFAYALILIAAFTLYRPQALRRGIGLLAGFVPVTLAMLVFLHFDVWALWSDMRVVLGARQVYASTVIGITFANAVQGALLGLLALMISVYRSSDSKLGALAVRRILAAGLTFAVGVIIICTNAQLAGMPLSGIFALILLNDIARRPPKPTEADGRLAGAFAPAALLLGLLLVFPAAVSDLGGVAYGVFKAARVRSHPAPAAFDAPPLADLLSTDENSETGGPAYVRHVNEGIELLRRNSDGRESIAALNFENPFSYALQRKPARGGSTIMVYGNTFSNTSKPSPERLVGAADILMVPTALADMRTEEALFRNYGDYIEQHFHLVAESASWRMYRRSLP